MGKPSKRKRQSRDAAAKGGQVMAEKAAAASAELPPQVFQLKQLRSAGPAVWVCGKRAFKVLKGRRVVAHYKPRVMTKNRALQLRPCYLGGAVVRRSPAHAGLRPEARRRMVVTGLRDPMGGPGTTGAYNTKTTKAEVHDVASEVVFEECCDLITGFREEPYMKDLWREAHAARDKDAPMMAFTGSLVTARSITMNYEAPPHLDEGDLDTGFILWYKVEPESTPNKKSSSRSSRSSGSSAGDAFCNPQTVFRLSCDVPADGSVEGGLQFAPCSQGVLMLDTTCVVHNAMCDVPQAKTRAQELQRGGMMGSALFFCRGTQSKVNRIFADVRRQQAAAKPSVQCRKGQEPK